MHVFKRLGKVPIIISLAAFLLFYLYIPTLTTPEPIENSAFQHVSGQITGSINKTPKKIDFVLKGASSNTKLLIIYFPNPDDEIPDDWLSMLKDGASCYVNGILQLPEKSRNPGQFNYREYLQSKGITYQLVIPSVNAVTCSGSSAFSGIYQIRTSLINHIRSQVSPVTAAWLSALVLGDDSLLEDQTVELFRRWSLSHILAISGLHVGLVVVLVYFILIKLNILTKEKAQWVMILFLPFYALLAGGEPSIWRATIMVMLFICLNKLKLRYSATDALSIVFLLLVLADKYIVYQVGFQFSFLVTFGLLLSGRWFADSATSFILVLRISFVSQMIILPLQVHYFYTFQPLSIILNGLVVPYFSLFVIPFMFLLFILSPLPGFFTELLDMLFTYVQEIFITVLQIVDQLFYFPFIMGEIPIIGVSVYYGLFIILMKQMQGRHLRKAFHSGCLITLLIISITLKPYFSPVGSVTMLDIGQGDAFVIELPYRKAVIMIDAGAKVKFGESATSDQNYEQIIKPYLLSKGIGKVDAVILSHEDTDHIGSVPFMIQDMDVENILISEYSKINGRQLGKDKDITVKRVVNNQVVMIGGQTFYVLSPTIEKPTPNENSLVLYTELGGLSWLFTGDVDKKTEQEIIEAYPDLTVDVLKVSHHGSDTATDPRFLNQIKPEYAFISVGKNNSYGHPSDKVLRALNQEKVHTFRTDKNGAVTYRFRDDQGTFFKFLP